MTPEYKIPQSVLVVIYTPVLDVLLLERADHPGYWQSVTGSRAAADEPLVVTCAREVAEETGRLEAAERFEEWNLTHRYAIYPQWRHRYAPGVIENTEHVFGLELPQPLPVRLAPREHLNHVWLPWQEAAKKAFSWTNAQAIRTLTQRCAEP